MVSPKIKQGISDAAKALGINPVDLATAISYETAGTFDPKKAGPTTQWGQHRGFIQFGEPQAREYGVDWKNPIDSQLGENGAVAKYLKKAGVKPGMGLLDIYSAINAGQVGLYNRTDENNGGAAGTVRDKVEQQMSGHIKNAQNLFGENVVKEPDFKSMSEEELIGWLSENDPEYNKEPDFKSMSEEELVSWLSENDPEFDGQKTEKQSKASGVLDRFTDTLTFGLGDELTAAESAVLGRTPEGGFFDYEKPIGERYSTALEAERGQQEQFQKESPGLSITADVAAGLAGGLGGAKTLAKNAPALYGKMAKAAGKNLATRSGSAAAAGVTASGVTGFNEGQGGAGERASNALSQAPYGALAGGIPVAASAGRAVGRGGKWLLDKGKQVFKQDPFKSEKTVQALIDETGNTVDDVVSGIEKGLPLGAQNESGSRLLGVAGRSGGAQTGDFVNTETRRLVEKGNKQVVKDLRRANSAADDLGQGVDYENFPVNQEIRLEALQKKAKPAYEDAYKKNYDPESPQGKELVSYLNKIMKVPEAFSYAKNVSRVNLRPFGKNSIFNEEGGLVRVPDLQEAEEIRRSLRDLAGAAYRDGKTGLGNAYKQHDLKIKEMLDNVSPELKRTRQQYSNVMDLVNAGDLGRSMANKKPADIIKELRGMTNIEKAEFKRGAIAGILENLDGGVDGVDLAKRVFNSPKKRKLLKSLYDDPKEFKKLEKSMEKRIKIAQMRNTATGGSQTARNQADEKAMQVNIGQIASQGVIGNTLQFVNTLINKRASNVKNLSPEDFNKVARLLLEENPTRFRNIMEQASKGKKGAQDELNKAVKRELEIISPFLFTRTGEDDNDK